MASVEALVNALAKVAFTVHYEQTKQPHWLPAEEHWLKNPQARSLWHTIVLGVLSGAETAGAAALPNNAAGALLAKMTRPGGPMTPLPSRAPAYGPADVLSPPEDKPPFRMTTAADIMRAPYGGADVPPGLAIERHDCEEPEPHSEQALREHSSGEPEE